MFFKVNITGCQERKGLVEVRYDCYLDPTEPAWKMTRRRKFKYDQGVGEIC
jgi:hypothetical protein